METKQGRGQQKMQKAEQEAHKRSETRKTRGGRDWKRMIDVPQRNTCSRGMYAEARRKELKRAGQANLRRQCVRTHSLCLVGSCRQLVGSAAVSHCSANANLNKLEH